MDYILKSLLNLLQYCFCCLSSDFLTMRHEESQLLNQGSKPHLLHWKVKSYPLNHQGSPYTLASKLFPLRTYLPFLCRTFPRSPMALMILRVLLTKLPHLGTNFVVSSSNFKQRLN